jgi:hypothetical protein
MTAAIFVAGAAAIGMITGDIYFDNGMLRRIVIAPVMDAAAECHDKTFRFDIIFAAGGVVALLLAFGSLAAAASEAELVSGRLRQRLTHLQACSAMGGLLLVLLVLTSRSLAAWAGSLLPEKAAADYAALGQAVTGHWGVLAATILLTAVSATWFMIERDREKLIKEQKLDNAKKEQEWIEEQGLALTPLGVVSGAITSTAPLFAGPVVELLSRVLG